MTRDRVTGIVGGRRWAYRVEVRPAVAVDRALVDAFNRLMPRWEGEEVAR